MPRRKNKAEEPTKRPVPAYMTSFADMMTLMLTFFILLVAFAQEQRAELVAAGTGSFINAIDTLGLPGLLPGGRRPINLDQLPPNFTIPQRHVEPAPGAALLNEDLLEAPPDRLRRATVDYLKRRRSVAFSTPVAFQPGTDRLEPSSHAALDRIAELARSRFCYLTIEAHVSGPGDGWLLSSLRAAAVARYLHDRGIAYRRMQLAGCGRFRPVARQHGARASNDRVRIILSPERTP